MQNTFKGLKHDDKPLLFLLLSKQITEMGIYHYSWWLNCNYQEFSIDFFFLICLENLILLIYENYNSFF